MIKPQIYRDAVNRYWRERSLTDDEFYFGLGDRIKERQKSKIPVPGAGLVDFLQLTGAVTAGAAVFYPPLRAAVKVIGFAEKAVKEKSQSTE